MVILGNFVWNNSTQSVYEVFLSEFRTACIGQSNWQIQDLITDALVILRKKKTNFANWLFHHVNTFAFGSASENPPL